jgi:hypothetical protein
MRFSACTLYRPARTADGQGGWRATCEDGVTLFGVARVDLNRTTFLCRAEEDVRLEDVIEIGGRHYRVVDHVTVAGQPLQAWELELTEKPAVAPATTTAAD